MKKWILLGCLALLGTVNVHAGQALFDVQFGAFTGTTPNPLYWGPLTMTYSNSNILVNSDGYLGLFTDSDGGGILYLAFSYPTWGLTVNFSQTLYNGAPLETTALAYCDGADPVCSGSTANGSFTYAGSSTDLVSSLALDFVDAFTPVPGTPYQFLVDSITFTSDIPEPGSFLLLGAGLLALGGRKVWRRRLAA